MSTPKRRFNLLSLTFIVLCFKKILKYQFICFVFFLFIMTSVNIVEPKYLKLTFKHFEFWVSQWKKSKCLVLTEKNASLAFTFFFMYTSDLHNQDSPKFLTFLSSAWCYRALYCDPKCRYSYVKIHYCWNIKWIRLFIDFDMFMKITKNITIN